MEENTKNEKKKADKPEAVIEKAPPPFNPGQRIVADGVMGMVVKVHAKTGVVSVKTGSGEVALLQWDGKALARISEE